MRTSRYDAPVARDLTTDRRATRVELSTGVTPVVVTTALVPTVLVPTVVTKINDVPGCPSWSPPV